jgi:hypothetical protein
MGSRNRNTHGVSGSGVRLLGGHAPAQQEIASAIHKLHGVVLAAPIRVVLPCGSFPSPGHINLRDPARQGQVQALPRHDCIQIRVLAQGAPIGLA